MQNSFQGAYEISMQRCLKSISKEKLRRINEDDKGG
jgi:hypothetical protein